jgi:anti-sigma factor RsiW
MDSYLSEELLVETNHEILRHLAACSDCMGELERRRRARLLLKDALAIDGDTEALKGRIHAAIAADRRWFPIARRWALAAALVALFVMAYGRYGGRVQAAPTYRDAVVDHIECGLTRPAGTEYDPAQTARWLKPPFTDLPVAAGLEHQEYRLIDAHTCPFKGRRYAHLVYRRDGRVVSVFADPTAGWPLPASDLLVGPHAPVPAILGARYRGFEVAAMATRAHQVLVVSDLTRDANLELARDLFPGVAKFVEELERWRQP